MARNPPNISCLLWHLCRFLVMPGMELPTSTTMRWGNSKLNWQEEHNTLDVAKPRKKKRSRQNAHRNVWPNNIFYWSKKCGCGHLCVISILVCIYLQLRPFYSTDNAIGIIMGPKLGWVKKIQEIRAIVVDIFTGSRYRKRWAFTPFWTWPGGMNEILFVKMGVTNFSFLFFVVEKITLNVHVFFCGGVYSVVFF